jgi:hypothetical protein
MKEIIAVMILGISFWTVTVHASDCEDGLARVVVVLDSGSNSSQKSAAIKSKPLGSTKVSIERDGQGAIERIVIEQTVTAVHSGALMNINALLSELLAGEVLAREPSVQVKQHISLVGNIEVSGVRFEGVLSNSNNNLKLIVEPEIEEIGDSQTFQCLSIESNIAPLRAYRAGITLGGRINAVLDGGKLVQQAYDTFIR